MNYKNCPDCHGYTDMDNHTCELYLVHHEDYTGNNPVEIYSQDFDLAAEIYAIQFNEVGDLLDKEISLEVEKNGIRKKFTVSAEPSVYYNITEKD